MDLIIVRHAIAEEREVFAETGESDGLRPLTPKGRKRMRRGAGGLKELVPQVDLIATSPLVRARETAEILGEIYDGISPIEIPELEPGASQESMLHWLQNQRPEATIMLVGHEPFLSMTVSWLTTRSADSFIELKKGGACFITFDEGIYAGGAAMLWLLTPAQLRSLST